MRSQRWMTPMMLCGTLLCLWPTLAEARGFDPRKGESYQEALDISEQIAKEIGPQPETRRVKIRALIHLGKPKEALLEYEHLTQGLKQDDRHLLKEVVLGFAASIV